MASIGNAPRHYVAGAETSSTSGTISPPWDSLHRAGDIGLLPVITPIGVTPTLSTANGFTLIGSVANSGVDTTGCTLTLFWARATTNGASMSAPVLTFTGDHAYARILGFRGCVASGSPINVSSSGSNGSTAGTSLSIPGLTTTINDCLVVAIVGTGVDSAAPGLFSSWANAGNDLHYLAEWFETGTASGHGGTMAITDGVKADAGAFGAISATRTSGLHAWWCIALAPLQTDETSPTISGYSPAAGSTITRDQAIQFDVTDETGLASALVMATLGDGQPEVVHDGTQFRGRYASLSTRSSISGGYRFVVRRTGGWTSSPTIQVVPVDTGGNVGA